MNFLKQLWNFFSQTKKYWLLQIVIVEERMENFLDKGFVIEEKVSAILPFLSIIIL